MAWPPSKTTTARDVLASYKHLGGGTVVEENYQQPQVRLDYIGDGGYSGFDQFGRVVDQLRADYASTSTAVGCRAVAAGRQHALALREDGSLIA